MITIISGTNRKDAATHIFAQYYFELMKNITEEEVQYLSLEMVSSTALHNAMYSADHQDNTVTHLQDQFIIPATKIVILSPEYNGSYPGIVKLFIDACSIREYKKSFSGKKIGLIGIASGRAGNLRGLDHLSDIFQHMGSTIYPNKLPISSIGGILNEDKKIEHEGSQKALEAHARGFLAF